MLRSKIMIQIFTTFIAVATAAADTPTYNVKSFGAKSNGKSDCTKAFLSAWSAACAAAAPAVIYVPPGRYLLRNAKFAGKSCKSADITIRIDGTLVAPADYNVVGNSGSWLKFERVTGVSIYGGTLDGRGAALWNCKNSSKSCPKGATVSSQYQFFFSFFFSFLFNLIYIIVKYIYILFVPSKKRYFL